MSLHEVLNLFFGNTKGVVYFITCILVSSSIAVVVCSNGICNRLFGYDVLITYITSGVIPVKAIPTCLVAFTRNGDFLAGFQAANFLTIGAGQVSDIYCGFCIHGLGHLGTGVSCFCSCPCGCCHRLRRRLCIGLRRNCNRFNRLCRRAFINRFRRCLCRFCGRLFCREHFRRFCRGLCDKCCDFLHSVCFCVSTCGKHTRCAEDCHHHLHGILTILIFLHCFPSLSFAKELLLHR